MILGYDAVKQHTNITDREMEEIAEESEDESVRKI